MFMAWLLTLTAIKQAPYPDLPPTPPQLLLRLLQCSVPPDSLQGVAALVQLTGLTQLVMLTALKVGVIF